MSEWVSQRREKCYRCGGKRHPVLFYQKGDYFARVSENAGDVRHGKWNSLVALIRREPVRPDGSYNVWTVTVVKSTPHDSEAEAKAAGLAALDRAIELQLTEDANA